MKKAKPERFGFTNHNASTKLCHVPIHLWVPGEFLNDEINFSGLAVEQNAITFLDLLSGLVPEFHRFSRQIHAAVNVEDVAGDVGGFVAG